MNSNSREILNNNQIDIIIERLCQELIENHNDFSNTVLVSLMPRGKNIGKKIHGKLEKIIGKQIKYGELDSSFYRDDLRRHSTPIVPHKMSMNLTVAEKNVVVIDDVLNSGATLMYSVKYFLNTKIKSLKTAVLVDRNHKKYPIKADFKGLSLSTSIQSKVEVVIDEKKIEAFLV